MSPDATFQALIAPHRPQTFLAEHWGQLPLHIPGGGAEKAQRWSVTPEELDALLSRTRTQTATDRPWRLVGPDNRIADRDGGAGVRALVASGSTLCFDGIDEYVTPLAALASDINVALNHAGRVFITAYASGGGGGFAHHFDYHSTFVLQVRGTKRWQISRRPAVPWPPIIVASERNVNDAHHHYPWMNVTHPAVDEHPDALDYELEPGDVLYLPAGTWHQAKTEDELSIALSIACMPFSAADLIDDVLRGRLGHQAPWRASIPPVLAEQCLSDRLPAAVEQFLADRLTELRDTVAVLTPADLYPAWAEHVATLQPGTSELERVDATVEPDDELHVDADAPIRYVHAAGVLVMYHRDARIDLDPAALPVIEHLCTQTRFRANDATGWAGTHHWDDIAKLFTALVHVGVLSKTARALPG